MMKKRIAQEEQKREEERTYLEQIDYLHIFNVLTVLKCREQMHHTEERAFIDGPSTSFLAEPTTSFNVSDSEESEEPGSEIESFQEPEAEELASETPINMEEKLLRKLFSVQQPLQSGAQTDMRFFLSEHLLNSLDIMTTDVGIFQTFLLIIFVF
ncbi:hypothetical protein SRHO_G00297600 [Serrasalmus rhombeus]